MSRKVYATVVAAIVASFAVTSASLAAGRLGNFEIQRLMSRSGTDDLPPEFVNLGEFVGVSDNGTAWFVMETGNPDCPVAGYHGITPDDQHCYCVPTASLGSTVDGIQIHMTPTQLIGTFPDGRWFIAPVELLETMEENECGL